MQLDIFPREVALALGPLVRRLASAIGEWRSLPEKGLVEPDGFAGLSRRGHYERLLTTEWLLAEEAPLEFLRRAAQGEHAFLQIARRDPQNAGFCAVLCDAGPNQLGSPRIAQMAALLVLGRRALAANARFGWGILQQPGVLHGELTPAMLALFLNARGAAEATAQNIQDWREFLAAQSTPRASEEHWWLGGAHLKSWSQQESLLLLDDPLELETRAVDAAILAPAVPQRALRLELPEDKLCARLLRDPFLITTARPQGEAALANSSGLILTYAGSKLLIRTADEDVLAYAIPRYPQENQVSRRRYQVHHGFKALAAGREGKTLRIVGLKESGEGVVLSYGGKQAKTEAYFDWPAMPEELKSSYPWSGYLGACYNLPADSRHLAALLPGGHLIMLWANEGRYEIVQHHTDVVALHRNAAHLVCAAQISPEEFVRRRLGTHSTLESWRLTGPSGACTRVVTGYPGEVTPERSGFWATDDGAGWQVLHQGAEPVVDVPQGSEVCGCMMLGADPPEPALVALDARGGISLVQSERVESLTLPSARIVEATVGPTAPNIAYRTQNGELGVYSVTLRMHLLRVLPEEVPA